MNLKIGLLKKVNKWDFSKIYDFFFFLNVNNETFNL
jgi:hypothetical protein